METSVCEIDRLPLTKFTAYEIFTGNLSTKSIKYQNYTFKDIFCHPFTNFLSLNTEQSTIKNFEIQSADMQTVPSCGNGYYASQPLRRSRPAKLA